MRSASVLLLGLALTTAVSAAPVDDRRAVLSVIDRLAAALSARDVESVLSTFVASDDIVLLLPSPLVPMRVDGLVTARRALDIFFQDIPESATFRVTAHNTVVQLRGESALAYSYLLFYTSAGALPQRAVSRATVVLQNGTRGWRINHLHAGTLPEVADFLSQLSPKP